MRHSPLAILVALKQFPFVLPLVQSLCWTGQGPASLLLACGTPGHLLSHLRFDLETSRGQLPLKMEVGGDPAAPWVCTGTYHSSREQTCLGVCVSYAVYPVNRYHVGLFRDVPFAPIDLRPGDSINFTYSLTPKGHNLPFGALGPTE